ncbi:MAG: RNA methyltransferase [Verrucomicrobia bacterium]|nr:RNA methyltransferase [Verrucomicrobiota bacterium]MDE3100059.1 RNA methyltransferase [Verrucomicrobiota bacterium]
MFRVEKISSFDAPGLRPYTTLRRPLEHRHEGIFVAESEKVVRRLLESRIEVVSLVLSEDWLAQFRPLLERRPENIIVYLVEKRLLEKMVGFTMFQGVLAVARVPAPPTVDDILRQRTGPMLLAALDGLANAENLGVLVRNCVAFGVNGLVVGETSSSPWLRRAVRNSMGAVFHLPIVELAAPHGRRERRGAASTLAQALAEMRARGVHCVAAHPRADKTALPQVDFSGDCCMVFGSEGTGISEPVLAACNEAAAIRTSPLVDSLNVGVAAAVFLYEAARQRAKL